MSPMTFKPAAATAVGSFPGVDPWETAAVVRGEFPDLPVLAELPARGPGADMIGRTLSLLAGTVSPEFAATTTTTGWRIGSQTSAHLPAPMRRGLAWLGEDLDSAQSQWGSYDGPFKVQLVGPWTVAAAVEGKNGEALLFDRGAVRDLAAATAHATSLHIDEVRRRLPAAQIVMQFDEPSLPAVLAGRIRTQSGWGTCLPVPEPEAKACLANLLSAGTGKLATAAVHCCGRDAPINLFREAGAQIVSVDLSFDRSEASDEAFGQLLDSDALLMAGVVDPMRQPVNLTPAAVLRPLLTMLSRLSMSYGEASERLLLSPSCGLAAVASLAATRPVSEALAAAGRALRDDDAETAEGERH
ncbi:MAG: methionine synthase [Candidatus Nanopelagicales bacterium]